MNKNIIEKLINLDKRIVYLFLLAAITLPFFLKPVLTLKTTKWVEAAYQLVEEAATRKKMLLLSFDFDPSTLAELGPMTEAVLRHAFSKNVKVVGLNFVPNGTSLAATIMDKIAAEYGKKYGEDYVFMGYIPQFMVVLLNFGIDLRKSFEKDFRQIKIDDIPILRNVKNYNDFHAVFDFTGTKLAQYFIIYGVNKFNFNFVAGVTAVSATEFFTYLQSGQMKGFIPGMKGAAEYEAISGHTGEAMRGMASQSWGHWTIILFIFVGNVLYYLKKRMDKKES